MTRQFHKHFSGAVLFKYFLWLALVPAILSFNGCGSVDENEKKKLTKNRRTVSHFSAAMNRKKSRQELKILKMN